MKLLLDWGADIHASDDWALRSAANFGHTETVKLLLERGANAKVVKLSQVKKNIKKY